MDLYTWGTPNGHKIHIMLEECAADCRVHAVDINDSESLAAHLSGRSLNKKIPVLVDYDANSGEQITVFESGAILIYLADKYQKFIPTDASGRYRAIQWLMFQMSAVGPMMGQLSHFKKRNAAEDAYALGRFWRETQRLHNVMEEHLDTHVYFAGDQYSIADMAIFPWVRVSEKLGVSLTDFPRLSDWYDALLERPAVQRALELPKVISPVAA